MSAVALAAAEETALYGDKAVQLGRACRAGLPVPPGLALSHPFVEAVAAGEAGAVATLRSALAPLDGPVAVRSSAIGEDSAEASFAGQHATILNMRTPAAVIEAVQAVWGSGRTEAALAYRRRLGVAGSPQVAIVIQRQIMPDCAGVLFTCDPLTRADVRVIEAAWGLGEAVVAGLVVPDSYRLSRDGQVLQQTIGTKDLQIVADPDGSTVERAVEPAMAGAPCLDEVRLDALGDLATTCEAVFGPGPHDVEWAWSGDQLHFLQRRPIVGLR